MTGPLDGLHVIELSGIGPGPFAGMVLSDLGADVVAVDRPRGARPAAEAWTPPGNNQDPLARGRRSIVIDLKEAAGKEVVLRLAERADVLFEPFRPGVAERLGIGPADCLGRNPRLIYGRMTGWGRDGPYGPNAGHDINYIALAGALEGSGRAGAPPTFAQNLVGDFGGGGMLLIVGILAALYERDRSGVGQVVDAAMIDGVALLTAFVRGMRANGRWSGARGTNVLDSGSHFYDVYETSDGKWISIGANEPQFYARLLECMELSEDADLLHNQMERDRWPEFKIKFSSLFRSRTRDEWCALLEDEREACFAPVLDLDEAPQHRHNVGRETFIKLAGIDQPAPAPRFSRTIPNPPTAPPKTGEHTDLILSQVGFSASEIAALRDAGAVS
jgi:alpha-methylacyl-CoA racemase